MRLPKPRVVVACALLLTVAVGSWAVYVFAHVETDPQADLERFFYERLKKDRCINEAGLNWALWVRAVSGRSLQDVLFKRRDGKGGYDLTARAQQAELRVNLAERKLEIKMCRCNAFSKNEDGRYHGYFEERTWLLDLPAGWQPRPSGTAK